MAGIYKGGVSPKIMPLFQDLLKRIRLTFTPQRDNYRLKRRMLESNLRDEPIYSSDTNQIIFPTPNSAEKFAEKNAFKGNFRIVNPRSRRYSSRRI